jgi:hypothetical protein
MRVFLNEQAEHQLKLIMAATGYTNATHCIQTMVNQVSNKLKLADAKKAAKKTA